jgi:membrane protease YdiL (CAAX protease family)
MTTDDELPPLNPLPLPGEPAAVRPVVADAEREAGRGGVPAFRPTASSTTLIDTDSLPPPGTEDIVTAELVHPPATTTPIWTALLAGILAIPLASVIGGVILMAAMFASHGPALFRGDMSMTDWLEGFAQTRWGLLVLVVPGQLVFLGVAVGAAWLSPQAFTARLGLRWGALPRWTWLVLMLGTPMIGMLSSHLLSLLTDDLSDQLKLVESMMRTHVRDFPVGLIVIVAVLPGFVEELLFRGYLQSRLLRRWPPLLAVGVSALVFSAAHLDPIHVLGVIPLGLWLGTIAWRAESVWPAMLCHAVNNIVAVVGAACQDASALELTLDPFSVTLLAVGGPAFLVSLGILAFSPTLERGEGQRADPRFTPRGGA